MFKTLSGLALPGRGGDDGLVLQLAGQWERLAEEVAAAGGRHHWDASHPFGPLRIRAMDLYSKASTSADPVSEIAACERAISRMLGMMDPGGNTDMGDGADPLLNAFLFWGGLYVALADGMIAEPEARRLQSFAPSATDVGTYARSAGNRDTHLDCLENFRKALAQRRVKLTAVELHRIMFGLIDVASADGRIDEHETERLYRLGGILGIPPGGCEQVAAQYRMERERGFD